MKLNNVAIPVSADLFDEAYPGPQIDSIRMKGYYVSESVTRQFLRGLTSRGSPYWSEENGSAIILKAPVGRGKTSMVIIVLRSLAADEGEMVLLLCNRAALHRQLVLEAAKAVNPIISDIPYHEDMEVYETGSITLMTYHRFYADIQKGREKEFHKYKYCVFDEAHFFFSDALFNANTGEILKLLPKVFKKSLRIYMTATPENVLAPIYSAEFQGRYKTYLNDENKAIYRPELGKYSNLETLPRIPMYVWDTDFSVYRDICVFSKEDCIVDAISKKASDKWVVFVNSKEKGKEMQKILMGKHIHTLYVDRESRNSTDFESRKSYEKLIETGCLNEYQVLIATSVLDNGFSIHDKTVRHIVLFTDERTEFLQELGRVRLAKGQKVKIYIAKMTKQFFINETRYKKIINTVALCIGNKNMREFPFPDAEIKADPFRAEAYLVAGGGGNTLKGILQARFKKTTEGELAKRPYLNDMARWSAIIIKREMDAYTKMLEEEPDRAPVWYKLQWLSEKGDASEFDGAVKDLDIPDAVCILNFLDSYAGQAMEEPKKAELDTERKKLFQEFSKAFQSFFKEVIPEDSSLNGGANRMPWKHKSIQSHLAKLMDKYSEELHCFYQFDKADDGYWYLKRSGD